LQLIHNTNHIHYHITTPFTSLPLLVTLLLFFFNDPATTEIYTLSLHDARSDLQSRSIPGRQPSQLPSASDAGLEPGFHPEAYRRDRKSTRLNSSHDQISYAVFCLKKKKQKINRSVDNSKLK